jgi:hypothetical protein
VQPDLYVKHNKYFMLLSEVIFNNSCTHGLHSYSKDLYEQYNCTYMCIVYSERKGMDTHIILWRSYERGITVPPPRGLGFTVPPHTTVAMYTEIHQSKKIHCIVYIVCPSLSVSTQCRGTEGSDSNAQSGARSHDLREYEEKTLPMSHRGRSIPQVFASST